MDLLEPTRYAFYLLFTGDPDLWRIIFTSLYCSLAAIALIAPDRKSTRLNSSHIQKSRMPSSA